MTARHSLLLLAACAVIGWTGLGSFLDAFWVSDDFGMLPPKGLEWPLDRVFAIAEGAPFFRPLPALVIALEHRLFGTDPSGYRICNLLPHILAGWCLGLALVRLTQHKAAGVGAALLWAASPLQHEAVCWLAGCHYTLGALFVALACLAAVTYTARGNPLRLAGAAAAATGALLSCEAAAPMIACTAIAARFTPGTAARRRNAVALTLVVVLIAYVVVRTLALGGLGGYRTADGASVHTALSLTHTARFVGRVVLHILAPGPWDGADGTAVTGLMVAATACQLALVASVPWPRVPPRAVLKIGGLFLLALTPVATWGRLDANLIGARLVYLPMLVAACGAGCLLAAAWDAQGWRRRVAGIAFATGIALQVALLHVVGGWWYAGGEQARAVIAGVGAQARATGAEVAILHGPPNKHRGAEVLGRCIEGAVHLFADPDLTVHAEPDDARWQLALSMLPALRQQGRRVIAGEWDAALGGWRWH